VAASSTARRNFVCLISHTLVVELVSRHRPDADGLNNHVRRVKGAGFGLNLVLCVLYLRIRLI